MPGAEIQQYSGQFKEVSSFNGANGFILSSFDKKQKFIFEKQVAEGGIHYNSFKEKVQSKDEYLNSGTAFLNKLKTRKLSKAIFSRVKEVGSLEKPENIFNELALSYPDAFVYLISSPFFGTWVGASPEVLLHVEKGQGRTVALAGTKATGDKSSWGVKEKVEQKIVSDFIDQKLVQLKLEKVKRSNVKEFIAGPVKHLVKHFSFEQGEVAIADIIELLHPTPAVCGLPIESAMKLIEEEEQHNRSLYAGVIGVIAEDESKLFVNLRCAQLFEQKALLYIGGGYTVDSIVEDEWLETENKAKTLLKVL